MDLREAWKKLEQETLNQPVAGTVVPPNSSKHPVAKLIQGFTIGLGFIIFFEIIFLYLLFVMPQPVVKVGLAFVVLTYIWFWIINYGAYKKIRRANHLDQNTKSMLVEVYTTVNTTMAFQRKISWGIFPLCAAAGFVLGLSIESDAATLLTKPAILIALVTTMVVLTPLCYFLSKWMTNVSYGKYCKQLKALIDQMEEHEKTD